MSDIYTDSAQDIAHGIVELIGHGYSDESIIASAIERHVKDLNAALTERAEKAEAACAELTVMLRDAKWICDHVVRMEDGGKNYIVPLAKFARKPLPDNPGSALLNEVKSLREKVKAGDELRHALIEIKALLPGIRWEGFTVQLDMATKLADAALAAYNAISPASQAQDSIKLENKHGRD